MKMQTLKNFIIYSLLKEDDTGSSDPLLGILGINVVKTALYTLGASLENILSSLKALGKVLVKGAVRIITPSIVSNFDPEYAKIFTEDDKRKKEIQTKYKYVLGEINLLNHPDFVMLAFLYAPGPALAAGILKNSLLNSLKVLNVFSGGGLTNYINTITNSTRINIRTQSQAGGYTDYDWMDLQGSSAYESINNKSNVLTEAQNQIPAEIINAINNASKSQIAQQLAKEANIKTSQKINSIVQQATKFDGIKSLEDLYKLIPSLKTQLDSLLNSEINKIKQQVELSEKDLEQKISKETNPNKKQEFEKEKQELTGFFDKTKSGLNQIADETKRQQIEKQILSQAFQLSIKLYKDKWIAVLNQMITEIPLQVRNLFPAQFFTQVEDAKKKIEASKPTI